MQVESYHQWNTAVLIGLVQNTSYVGDLIQGKRKSKLLSGKKGVRKAHDDELIVVKDNHEPIVSRELFALVNSIVANDFDKVSKKDMKTRQALDFENVFRNVVFCGKCGKKLKSSYYQSRITDERNYGYYCKGAYYVDERKCEKNYIKEFQLVSYVRQEVQKILAELKLQNKDLCGLNHEAYRVLLARYEEERQQLGKQSEMILKRAGEVFVNLKEGKISRDEYLNFRKVKSEQELYCEKRKTEILKDMKQLERREKEENTFLRSLLKVNSEKKLNIQLVEALVDKILVYPEGIIDIHFKFNREDENYEQ